MANQKFTLYKQYKESITDEEEKPLEVDGSVNQKVPEKFKTLLELSKLFQVDKQKVYRCVKKNNIPYQEINGVIYLNETEQTLLKSNLFSNIAVSNDTVDTHQKTVGDMENDTVMKQLETVIQMLQEELKSKTQQLNEKDKQIAELTKLVDQQQQLHLVEQKKVLQLEQKEPVTEKKKGFFRR